MARARIDVFEARRVVVNAIVYGKKVTLFDCSGRRLIEFSLSRLEGSVDLTQSDSHKWLAMMEMKLWRLSQQVWKLGQDPWEKKIASLANGVRVTTTARGRVNGLPRFGKPSRKANTWKEAFKRMGQRAHAAALPQKCAWGKWSVVKTNIINQEPRKERRAWPEREGRPSSEHPT